MLFEIFCCISYKEENCFQIRVDTLLAIEVKGGHCNKNVTFFKTRQKKIFELSF